MIADNREQLDLGRRLICATKNRNMNISKFLEVIMKSKRKKEKQWSWRMQQGLQLFSKQIMCIQSRGKL